MSSDATAEAAYHLGRQWSILEAAAEALGRGQLDVVKAEIGKAMEARQRAVDLLTGKVQR